MRRQGRIVVNFCLDYQIEQNNLLRENIEKNRYSLRKARKVETKKSLMWPWNSDEDREDKQAQKQLSTSFLYLNLMKMVAGNWHTVSETLSSNFSLCHLGKTTNESRMSALVGWLKKTSSRTFFGLQLCVPFSRENVEASCTRTSTRKRKCSDRLAFVVASLLLLVSRPFSRWNKNLCFCACFCACSCISSEILQDY